MLHRRKSLQCRAAASIQISSRNSGTASAEAESITDKVYDAILLRPLGGITMLVGGALFVPTSLLAATGGRDTIEEAWKVMVVPR